MCDHLVNTMLWPLIGTVLRQLCATAKAPGYPFAGQTPRKVMAAAWMKHKGYTKEQIDAVLAKMAGGAKKKTTGGHAPDTYTVFSLCHGL